MIHREDVDSVAVLRMAHGKANALDLDFLEAITKAVADLENSPARAAVLTGDGAIFSAGVDLFQLLEGGDDYLDAFLSSLDLAFGTLFRCPTPIVAAINGHAIAGGCVIAAACDHRIITSGKARMGLTELLVGVPFPTTALAIMRSLLAPAQLTDLVLSGITVPPEDALRRGLVDRIEDRENVLEAALAQARHYASIPASTFAMTKGQLRRDAWAEIDANPDAERVRAQWGDAEVRERLAEYVRQLSQKKG